MKHNPVQMSFAGGELSPQMYGRVDQGKYAIGCKRIKNFTVLPQGGLRRRSGTMFVGPTRNSATKQSRLVTFQFSTTQAYILEFSDGYVRFYANHGQVQSGGAAYEIVSPYTITQVWDLAFTQSADILYITHPTIKPKKLERLGPTNWVFVDYANTDGPYLNSNTDTTKTISTSATTGSVTLTANFSAFVATDVGRLVRLEHGTVWGCAVITAYSSATVVTATVQTGYNFGGTAAVSFWRLGAWSDTTGWPRCSTFHQGRLWFGNTSSNPQTVWGTYSGDFERFSPTIQDTSNNATITDSCAVTFTIGSNKVNAIYWLVTSRVLVIGTASAEWVVNGGNGSYSTITPTSIQVTQQTTYGTAFIPGNNIVAATIWIQRGGRRMVESFYNFGTDSYQGRDLSLVSQHLLLDGGGSIAMAFQQEPDSIIWVLRADGILLGCTYLREQEMVTWHQHQIGGSFNGGPSVVESIAVIPTPDGTSDELWMIVKRTINGATVRYIEYLEQPFRTQDPSVKTGMHFLDSCSVYSGAATTTVTGLDYLNGETVSILADGSAVPDQVVTGGTITLTVAASEVAAGYVYKSQLGTLRIDGGGDAGTAQGKIKRYHRITIRFQNSLSAEFGTSLDNLYTIVFRENADPLGHSPLLFSGDKVMSLDSSYDRDGSIWIEASKPYPMEILAIMPEGVVYG